MTHREHLLGKALMTMLVALPLTAVLNPHMQLEGSTLLESPVMADVRETARTYRETVMQEARIITQWREKCGERVLAEPTFICPSFYDREAVRAFLMGTDKTATQSHAAAGTGSSTVALSITDLDEKDQALLRRYMNAHNCPSTLKNYSVKGFYELCLKTIFKSTSRDVRMGIGTKVQERFKQIKGSVDERRAARMKGKVQ